MRRFLRAHLLALTGSLLAPVSAFAWPYLDVTGTEVLSTDPLRVRTTFTITEVGFRPEYDEILVIPLNHATTRLYDCAAVAPSICQLNSDDDTSALVLVPTATGPEGDTFQVVSNQQAPCVRFMFIDVLLGGILNPVHADDIDACLSTDLPVPTRQSSWGGLKSQYR